MILFLILCVSNLFGQNADDIASQSDRQVESLPRVLIIGDSISLGYTPFVKKMLADQAEVVHNPGNGQHTGTGLEKLDQWLGDQKWDVIHFNWGLWDLCYRSPDSKVAGRRDKENGELTFTVEEYAENLEKLVKRLKATDAVLIWAATTPVPKNEPGRVFGDELKYNAAAAKIMEKHGVRINDLHAAMLPDAPKYWRAEGDVHYTEAGSKFLAEKVAQAIRDALESQGQADRESRASGSDSSTKGEAQKRNRSSLN